MCVLCLCAHHKRHSSLFMTRLRCFHLPTQLYRQNIQSHSKNLGQNAIHSKIEKKTTMITKWKVFCVVPFVISQIQLQFRKLLQLMLVYGFQKVKLNTTEHSLCTDIKLWNLLSNASVAQTLCLSCWYFHWSTSFSLFSALGAFDLRMK